MSRAAQIAMAAFLAGVALTAAGLAGEAPPVKNEGQEDLDKAVQAKMNAKSLGDLGEVVRLCESAMKKGLDEDNTRFAKRLLGATLAQRGIFTSRSIFEAMPPDPRWRERRRAAVEDLEKAVKLDPEQPEALLRIAQLNLLPEGDGKRANEALDDAIRRADDVPPVKARALVLRADLQTDPAKKLADLDEALRVVADNVGAIWDRAKLHEQQGRMDAALADLSAAVKLDPRNPILLEAKAMMLAKMKRFDEARAVTREWRRLSPKSTDPLVVQARIESLVPDYNAALKAADEALALDPTSVVALLTRAMIHQELKDRHRALADVEKAVQLEPKNFLARRLLFGMGKSGEAIAGLEEQIKTNPDDVNLRQQLAMLYAAAEQPDKAVEAYTAILAKAPKDFEALRGRGDALLGIGKHAEAIRDYEAAHQLNAKDSLLLNNFAWVLATSPFDQLRNGKRALSLAEEACRLTGYKRAFILSTLGAAHAELGNFEEAMKWSKKAIELGEKEQKEDLLKELESYKARKPIRELKTGKEEGKDAKPGKEQRKPEKPAKEEKKEEKKPGPPDKPKPPKLEPAKSAKPEPAKPPEKPKPS